MSGRAYTKWHTINTAWTEGVEEPRPTSPVHLSLHVFVVVELVTLFRRTVRTKADAFKLLVDLRVGVQADKALSFFLGEGVIRLEVGSVTALCTFEPMSNWLH